MSAAAIATTNPPAVVATPAGTPATTSGGPLQPLSAARLGSLVSSQSIFPLLIVVAAFIAICVAAFLWAGGPTYQVLYSNLSEVDGGAVIGELDKRAIPYKFSPGGQAILVPSDVVHALRLQLAEQGLPKGGKVGFELMDGQAFGISQFAEQINYQRGLEGELARSMESLGPVANARIHLALAKASVFIKQRVPAKASVILNLHPGRTLSESQVNAIVHMVASSVASLAVENVSVVDQRGDLLSSPRGPLASLDGTQLKYTKEVEESLQQRVTNILAPILGNENFRVQVNAEVDFSAVEQTTEAYSPNQSPDKAAIRSNQTSTNFSGDEATARGIPGALSNTAPNWAPSPIENTEEGDEAAQNAAAQASLQRDNVVNYELDRNITHIKHQQGAMKRLSVAVVVNHRPVNDEEGNPVMEPLPEEELEQITRLVRQAVGFSVERGDQVEVINSPFSEVVVEAIEEPVWWQSTFFINSMMKGLRYLVVGIMILLGYRLIVKPLMRKHLSIEIITPGGTRYAAGSNEGTETLEGGGQNLAELPKPFKRADKSASYSEQLSELKTIAKEDPRMIAMIVRNWIKEDA